MMRMKGQSALEYLITYSWAIVAIGVIIMLLFELGVFNPSQWIPVTNEAIGLSVFGVTDFTVNGTGRITLYIVNNAQSKVYLTSIAIQGSPNKGLSPLTGLSPSLPLNSPPYSDGWIPPGGSLIITGNSNIAGTKGDVFYSDGIAFNYTIYNGAPHTDSGILRGSIE